MAGLKNIPDYVPSLIFVPGGYLADISPAWRISHLADTSPGGYLNFLRGHRRPGRLPELEKELAAENARLAELQKGQRMLREEVTEEDIASVVSKWTGVPVNRMIESETEKLLKMEDRLHSRVIGQE